MRATRRQFTIAAASLLALGPVGCASMSDDSPSKKKSLMQRLPWVNSEPEAPVPYPNPVKVAATWTPDTLVQAGRTPTRGFGGRFFFYDEKSRPVPVDGTLIVHGFDDTADAPEERVKRFEFTPEQFTRHFSQTDLGASYSVWIPWDAIGGDQRRISIVASFKTAEGKMVQGVPATIVLPGRKEELAETNATAHFSPQYKQYQDAQAGLTPRASGLTTTTIQRRRAPKNLSPELNPGINIPGLGGDSMVASKSSTPSLDVPMARRPSSSNIRPASAVFPIQR
jgi:hypothetical protein